MPKAYVSSTFKDLREHRLVAINTLDRLGYTTRAMEKYFASDERPLEMCLADLSQCDLYIGIFAWRYGTIPTAQNPERLSITECEFREALRLRIPCLIFLSDEDHNGWPHGDAEDLARITRLRTELVAGERSPGSFTTSDKLGLEISVAVSGWEIKPDFQPYLVALIAECLELPELPGRTRNLSLDQINEIFVNLPAASEASEGAPAASTINLTQVLGRDRSLLLVGEAGQGKTTALRFLAHHAARLRLEAGLDHSTGREALIPVYVSLRRDRSLRAQVWSALQRQTFRCSRELVDRWLRDRPFLLLLDGIENVDAQAVLDDADEIVRLGVSARCIIASRPHTVPARCAWPQAKIQPLSDSSLRALLLRLLGPERGDDLFNKLAQHKVLEPFRRPLFARLLALRSQVSPDRQRFTPAAVFRDVLESRFLSDWEQAPRSQARSMVLRDFLACLAYDMVERNLYLIDRDAAFAAVRGLAEKRGMPLAAEMLETFLDDALLHGLLVESDGGLQFWHSSFRDYFAAIWLEKQASAVAIYLRTWKRRWHEALVFYYGMLSSDRLSSALWRLLIGFRVISALLHLGPWGALSDRLLLVVRCLTQAGDAAPRQQRHALRRLPQSFQSWFLSGSVSPVTYSRFADAFDPYRYLCDLLGQMSVGEAFTYLRRVDAKLSVVAFGLMHDAHPSAISDLVQQTMELTSDDTTDVYLVSNLLLKSRDPRCLVALQGAVKEAGDHRRSRFLLRLYYSLEHYRCVPEERLVLEEQWVPLLIDYALYDENDEVRDAAVSFLHALSRDPAGRRELPRQAHDAFLLALGDANQVTRAHALQAMRFPALHDHLDVVWKLLDEDNSAMVFDALFHLRFCKKDSRFFRAVLKVIRRYAHPESVLHSRAGAILAELRAGHAGPRSRLRSIALLMSAAERSSYQPGSGDGLALYAVLTLGRMRIDWTAPFLAGVLREEGWDKTRATALSALIDLLGDGAQSFVLETLSDRSSKMREHAASICWVEKFGEDFPARSGPLLFSLIGDESEEVSRTAVQALKKFGFISKDWYPFQGPAKYLGPVAEEAAVAR